MSTFWKELQRTSRAKCSHPGVALRVLGLILLGQPQKIPFEVRYGEILATQGS